MCKENETAKEVHLNVEFFESQLKINKIKLRRT